MRDELHWLPVHQWIYFKLCYIGCYVSVTVWLVLHQLSFKNSVFLSGTFLSK